MASREVAVKRYVVRLSAEERERLEGLRRKGEIPARRLTKVQILLKADISEAGEGWSDSEIVKALDTTASMVYRTRRQLVEEGLDAALSRKARETPPVPRIFDGEKEAKLIALACSDPPEGFARWSLRLLLGEGRGARDRRSRQRLNDWPCFKKTSSSPIQGSVG